MSADYCLYLSERRWRALDRGLRRELCKAMSRRMYVGRQVGNIVSDLKARGERWLLGQFLSALAGMADDNDC